MDDTSRPAASASAPAMAMKKVGGPARKQIRSRATSGGPGRVRSGGPGRRAGRPPRHQDPVEQARDVGHRCRHEHRIGGAEPVDAGHERGLPAQPRWVCSTALGVPVDPEVNRATATSDGRMPREPTGAGAPRQLVQGRRVREGRRVDLQHEGGSIWPRAASTSAAPKECRTGAATAPMRQQARVSTAAARLLGTCQATASPRRRPARAESAGHRWPRGVVLAAPKPGGAVDHLAAVGREQGVEGGHVPGPPGSPVAPGLVGHPGRSEAGRHGRAPYPGPGNVTPMSGWWREPAWISR